jgi:hypothetical protein
MDLYNVLKKHGGKCKDTTVSVDLFQNVSQKGAAAACGGTTAVKIGELVLVIDGVSVDLSASAAAASAAAAAAAAAANNIASPPKTNGSARPRPPRPASVPSAPSPAGSAGATPTRSAPPLPPPPDLVNGHAESNGKKSTTSRLPPLPKVMSNSQNNGVGGGAVSAAASNGGETFCDVKRWVSRLLALPNVQGVPEIVR